MASVLDRAIDAVMVCTRCGAKMGACNCWDKCAHFPQGKQGRECACSRMCSCRWYAEPGKVCGNPETGRCSSRVAFGKYNRRTKRWE